MLLAKGSARDDNRPAKVHDLRMGSMTEAQPLQVWFKWAVWESCSQEEYDELRRIGAGA